MLLKEAVTLFLDDYQNLATRRAYSDALTPLLGWLGNDRTAAEVEASDLIRYTQKLRESNRADTTIVKHIKTIKTFFLWLERLGLVSPPNPVRAIRQKRIVHKIRKDKAMHDDELTRVLDYVKWKPRQHALILFLATTGCRAGGAAGLKIEDLDLEAHRAMVTEKGDKTRPVLFDEATANALRLWLIKREPCEHSYVFTWQGKKITSAAVGQIVRRACLRVGVRSLGSHSLRHRIGHKFAEEKVAPTMAQVYLGHTDVTITLQAYYPDDWSSIEDALRQIIQTPGSEDSVRQKIVEIHKKAK